MTSTEIVPVCTTANREAWLIRVIEDYLHPLFASHGYNLPTVRVSVGFPKASARAIGQCWGTKATKDQAAQIFLSPTIDDGVQVLATLIHELCHAIDDCEHGHKRPFAKIAKTLGLTGKMTATTAGEELRILLHRILDDMGDYPHAALRTGVEGGVGPKKQTTRMLKVECGNTGYTARTTRKWLDEYGAPLCPCCGVQMEEA